MANITLKELLEKRERVRAQRAQLVAEEANKKEEPKIEEPQESEKVEEKLEEEQEAEEPKKAPAKRGRKPAHREYMVVEDIENVND